MYVFFKRGRCGTHKRKSDDVEIDVVDLTEDSASDKPIEPDGTGVALQNQVKQRDEYGAALKKVKIEKEATEDALAEAKGDVEDGHELAQQQSLIYRQMANKLR